MSKNLVDTPITVKASPRRQRLRLDLLPESVQKLKKASNAAKMPMSYLIDELIKKIEIKG